MAKRIYLKEDGLSGSGPVPVGYKQIGYEGATFSEKSGFTSSTIGGGSEWIETIVNISSSQILNMGTTPIELLPAPGVNKYYEYDMILEANPGNPESNYDVTGCFFKILESYIDPKLIEASGAGSKVICRLSSIHETFENNRIYKTGISVDWFQGAIKLICFGVGEESVTPTGGNGTMRAIIKYKIRTFGE